jgi:hypothetical protein
MKNERLESFLRGIVDPLGTEFLAKYQYPLSAFILFNENDEEIRAIASNGLRPVSVITSLKEILNEDAHLAKCCGDAAHLAQAIDILFLKRLNLFTLGKLSNYIHHPLSQLDNVLYERDFEKHACFHLFNVSFLGDLVLKPPSDSWRFANIGPQGVPLLFGESSYHSFISPPETGTWFLLSRDPEGFDKELLDDWLARRWGEAQRFRQVMQYAVDGVLDIDYVCPYFSPTWVNDIHKGGLYYLGLPRRDVVPMSLQPNLTAHEQQRINLMWEIYIRHQEQITAPGGSLRKAIRIAGEFYEDHHRKTNRTEQFANLMIALEALFSPSDQSDHSFRISQNCALLARPSNDSAGRQEVFEFLRTMFDRRNKLFHGRYDGWNEGQEVLASDEEIKKLSSLVRDSILKFLSKYLKGENNLDALRKSLQKAALDEHLRNTLLNTMDIETLVDPVTPSDNLYKSRPHLTDSEPSPGLRR